MATGLALRVQYDVDVLPTREDIARRTPLLRDAYNSIDIAREAVDKTVSLIGGHDPRISVLGSRKPTRTKCSASSPPRTCVSR